MSDATDTTGEERMQRQWQVLLRDEDGRVIGSGVVKANTQIDAVVRARMVNLADVILALPPATALEVAEGETAEVVDIAGDVVLAWSTSIREGA